MPGGEAPTSLIDVSAAHDGGVMKEILQAAPAGAKGPSPNGWYEITCHYTGTLLDGTKFDSSHDRGKPFKFTIGQGQVIKGWDSGFASMKIGEKAVLICKPDYAYGKAGNTPNIPSDATLKFEVDLLSCEERQGLIKAEDRFKEGTILMLPMSRDNEKVRALWKQRSEGEEEDIPGFVDEYLLNYCMLDGETCAVVATKIGSCWRDVAIANKHRYLALKDLILEA
mmetsp:Transcript_1774/g.4193  ORF Transcript_1774/g.4193 Transcript_1774/m.4193 type:complete len:225 (-) Transcript_1774:137-811(-)